MTSNLNITNPYSIQNKITLDLQPSDFLFFQSNIKLSPDDCHIIRNTDCSGVNFDISNNSPIQQQCFEKELCENKSLAKGILTAQNTNLELNQRTADFHKIYENTQWISINLILGIIGMGLVFLYTKPKI